MTAYTLRISLDCPHCRGGVPVNAITEEVLCQNCLKGIPLEESWWDKMLDGETLDEAISCAPGQGTSSQHLGGMSEKIEAGNRPPRCQNCKTDFAPELMQKSAADGGFACPGCQQRIRVRKATPLALHLIHQADLLVHEDETGSAAGGDGQAAAEPVLFPCMACGAGLKVDGSSRMPTCTHCGSSNYLPDPLWLRLHPAVVSHAFFVTIKQDAKPPKVTIETLKPGMDADRVVRLLKDEDLEPAMLRRAFELYEDEDDVLEAIAKHRRTPDDLLMQLADSSRYYGVREQVAKRPHLSTRVLELLSTDDDSDVKKALMNRQDVYKQPEHILRGILSDMDTSDMGLSIQNKDFPEWKLYELCENCDPETARRLLQAPNISLRCMQRLGSNPENRAMIKEKPLYQGLSWWRKFIFFVG